MLSLVTGVGAKGQVGEAVASALVRRGDTVVIVARSDVSALASELGATSFACDLADPNAVNELAMKVRDRFGDQLDALVNVAGGFGLSGPLAESTYDSFERQMTINLRTAFETTRAFLPMVEAAKGSVVYFASEAALDGSRTSGMSGYAAAKAGVVALMRSVADEFRGRVRANAVAPSAIRTATNEASMGDSVRYLEREDVAAVVAFLTSAEAAAVTGQVLRL